MRWQAGGPYAHLFLDDFAFRLGMLQHRYPWYISDDLVHRWRSEAQQVRSFVHEIYLQIPQRGSKISFNE